LKIKMVNWRMICQQRKLNLVQRKKCCYNKSEKKAKKVLLIKEYNTVKHHTREVVD